MFDAERFAEAVIAVRSERRYQDKRWNADADIDADWGLGDWLAFIEIHINTAKHAIYDGERDNAVGELRKIAALAVAAMEQFGAVERESA